MYIVVNRTTHKKHYLEGNWNTSFMENLINSNNDIIVISLYSHTIKIPLGLDEDNSRQWKEFELPIEDITRYCMKWGERKR